MYVVVVHVDKVYTYGNIHAGEPIPKFVSSYNGNSIGLVSLKSVLIST